MLDWKPGDKLIAIKNNSNPLDVLPSLIVGREYTLARIEWFGTDDPCTDGCPSEFGVELADMPTHKDWQYCTCNFRKPLNLKKLFPAPITVHIRKLEDA